MDEIHQDITTFLKCKRIAIVGLSSKPDDFSHAIKKHLEEAGYTIFGVNPNLAPDPSQGHFQQLHEIDPLVEAVFLNTTPEVTEEVVKECHALGINNVWMHQGIGQGSVSPTAVAFCKKNGMLVIDKGCPMMFVDPDWFHRGLRWCKGMHDVQA